MGYAELHILYCLPNEAFGPGMSSPNAVSLVSSGKVEALYRIVATRMRTGKKKCSKLRWTSAYQTLVAYRIAFTVSTPREDPPAYNETRAPSLPVTTIYLKHDLPTTDIAAAGKCVPG